MDFIQNFISEELIYALGWTVMHSLWQGFLIAIVMAFALHVLRKKSASVRYEASVISLFLVLVSAVCTFIWYYDSAGLVIEEELVTLGQITSADPLSYAMGLDGFAQSCIDYFNRHLPLIVLIWLIGVAFFVLRLFGGLAYVQRLKYQRNTLLSAYWQDKVKVLTAKIPTKKTVQIFESASVKVPMVIGYFKPFILLPIGAVNQLEESEIEAIIAHELAHVFRNDFLMNIVLSFIEVCFYYHPAVWWISGNIRLERENCCDDIAVKVCGNSLIYAKALVRLQELNVYVPGFAMPFSGQKNQLLNRIKRILNQPQNRSNIMEKLTATCFLLVAIIFMSVSANVPEQNKFDEKSNVVVTGFEEENGTTEGNIVQDTVPDKKNLEGEILEITLKDGEVMEAKIDGQDVFEEELESLGYVETEGHVIVDYLAGSTVSPSSLQGGVNSFFLSRDTIKPTPNNIFQLQRQKSRKTITKGTNEDGQTIIIVEEPNREPVEIIVDEDVIIVEGNELKDGDQAIIIDEKMNRPNRVRLSGNISDLDRIEMAEFKAQLAAKEKLAMQEFAEKGLAIKQELATIKEADNAKLREQQLELEQHLGRIERNKDVLKLKNELQKKEYSLWVDKNKEMEARQKLLFLEGEGNQQYRVRLWDDRMGKSNTAQQIAQELKRDGLIKDVDNFTFSLTRKKLKVNGKKKPQAIFKKYKELYETLTGSELKNKSKYHISMSREG